MAAAYQPVQVETGGGRGWPGVLQTAAPKDVQVDRPKGLVKRDGSTGWIKRDVSTGMVEGRPV